MSTYRFGWTTSGIQTRDGQPVTVHCNLDYTKARPATLTEPGESESMELEEAWLGEYDIYYSLSEETVEEIQSLARDSLVRESDDWAESRAEAHERDLSSDEY